MGTLLNPILVGLSFLTIFAAWGAMAADDVDPAVVGTWELTVPGPGGNATWIWVIRPNGTYEFRIEGFGFPPGHRGTFGAADGKWTLTAKTIPFADAGTYELPEPDIFVAIGSLGTGRWRRQQPRNVESSEPRVAAYQGAIAREQGDHALAASWFVAAAALEEVRLSFLGLNVREQNGMDYRPHDIARLLAIYNAAADELNQLHRFDRTSAFMDINFQIYGQTSQESKYTMSPYGLLPEPSDDSSHIPEAPTIEALIVWSSIHAAKANVGQQRYDKALTQFEWAAAFESRKPPTMDQGMAVRIPGLWAKLGVVDIELRRGNGRAASQRMQMYGHPSIATPALQAEAERLRNAIEAQGFRAGGQTLHDLRDRQRRQLQQQDR